MIRALVLLFVTPFLTWGMHEMRPLAKETAQTVISDAQLEPGPALLPREAMPDGSNWYALMQFFPLLWFIAHHFTSDHMTCNPDQWCDNGVCCSHGISCGVVSA
jgi:hypothetical protein